MQTFYVANRKRRSLILLAIFAGSAALIALASFVVRVILWVLLFWSLFSVFALWNTVRSLVSAREELVWDGRRLTVKKSPQHPTFHIDRADWVFTNGVHIVIASPARLPKFNAGHLRSNGQELTIDGFHGSGFIGLREATKTLGPEKAWLWRYAPV